MFFGHAEKSIKNNQKQKRNTYQYKAWLIPAGLQNEKCQPTEKNGI